MLLAQQSLDYFKQEQVGLKFQKKQLELGYKCFGYKHMNLSKRILNGLPLCSVVTQCKQCPAPAPTYKHQQTLFVCHLPPTTVCSLSGLQQL